MKWFRHEVDSMNSERMANLINKFGWEGYGRFWRIMEIVAERMDESNRCWVELPEVVWLQKLVMRKQKFDSYTTAITYLFDIHVLRNGDIVRIEIPNLLQKRDNYTRNLQASSKKLPSKEVEGEEEVFSSKKKSGGNPILKFYLDEHKKKFGTEVSISWKKDSALMKAIVNTFGEEKTKDLIIAFMKDEDSWVQNRGRGVNIFQSQVNRLNTSHLKHDPYGGVVL